LQRYAWPGNVRELENTVERLLIMREGDRIGVDELPEKIGAVVAAAPAGAVLRLPPGGYSLEQLEMEAVVEALSRCDWNQTAAARFLRIPRHTLIYRMEKYNIMQPGRKG
jgi:DNA-binding NtrC family response regulator